MKTKFLGLLLCLVMPFVVACTSTETKSIYQKVSDATLKAGDAIPAPAGDAVLTVTGAIGASNVGESVQMDLATIESIGLVDYTVDDPFDKRTITYRGVLLSDLLKALQISDTATSLNVVALNDYAIDIPMEHVQKYPIVFALKADGEYMPVSTRGPAMLVYPYNDFEFDQAIYNDFWIWQIKSIDVR